MSIQAAVAVQRSAFVAQVFRETLTGVARLEEAQIHDFLSLQRLQLVLGLEAHGVERLGDEAVDGLVEVGGGCDRKGGRGVL